MNNKIFLKVSIILIYSITIFLIYQTNLYINILVLFIFVMSIMGMNEYYIENLTKGVNYE